MTRRLTIAVDVDDTVADHMGQWLNEYNLRHGDSVLPEDMLEWDVTKAVRPEVGEKIFSLLSPDIYDHVLPVPGARTAIEVMRLLGHRVVFVTACSANTADAKLEWLIRNRFLTKGVFNPDYIAASDKSLIRADVLLDDRPENVNLFPGMAWLISQPYNLNAETTRERLRSITAAPAAIERWLVDSPYKDAA